MQELFKLWQTWLAIASFVLSQALGWGLPMILPETPYIGILIIIIGAVVGGVFSVWAYILYRRQRSIPQPLEESKTKPQTDNLERVVVSILSKIHKRDLRLKNTAKKQYLTLLGLKDFVELWDNYASTRSGETYESIKKEFGAKELEKDKIQRRKQIDDVQRRLNLVITQEEWTLEEYIKLASFFENFPKTQNSVYQGIGRRRETDRKWQALFHSLNNLRLEYAQVFADKELTQMIDEYFDNSKVAVTGKMIIELIETLIPGDLLPTQYLEGGIEDANIKISNRMTKLLEDISKKITKLKSQ